MNAAPEAPRIWTIPPEQDFIHALVDGLWARFATQTDNPFALNDVTLLLPTKRACRAVRAGFLHRAGAKATLLPRMMPLGELDEDGLFLEGPEGSGADLMDLPAPISPLTRQWHLAHLLRITRPETPAPQRFRLATELGRLLDQWQSEQLDTSLLANLAEERFARHWQQTMQVLSVILAHWPDLLAEKNLCDPAHHRNLLLAAQANAWQAHPPAGPVFAAGSTGSLPATAHLLAVIAHLPQGEIILPGLDRHMPDLAWDAVEEQHPQFMLRRLLNHLGITRQDVVDWPGRAPDPPGTISSLSDRQQRMALLSWAMMPAATGDLWQDPAARHIHLAAALRGVTRIDAAHADEEALVIALMMRQTLEQPDRRALLVTPDRQLARRVSAMMGRWGVVLDDSAGVPLSETAHGSWLRLTARFGIAPPDQRRARDLLALLKHPLAGLGRTAGERLALTRQLECRVLRQKCRDCSWDGLRHFIRQIETDDAATGPVLALLDLVDDLAALFAPFEALLPHNNPHEEYSPAALIRAHGQLAEALAAKATATEDDSAQTASALWAGAAGEAAAGFFSQLLQTLEQQHKIGHLRPDDYPDILDDWLRNVPVRQHYGGDPRLGVRGPLEARLQQAEVVILAGLNEGIWPGLPAPDAWLSRTMRHQLKLPAAEQRIGQSAHDFIAACGAEEIFLTRAERQGGAPTVPARWLQRLDAMIGILQPDGPPPWQAGQALWLARARALDDCASPRPSGCPMPVPALSIRPHQISISDVETLLRDPYEFYMRKILRLHPLEQLEPPLGANERGQRIHSLLEQIIEAWRIAGAPAWDDIWHQRLMEAAGPIFDDWQDDPVVRGFWQPALYRTLADFSAWQAEDAATWAPLALECKASLSWTEDQRTVRLNGRADRLDRHRDDPAQIRIMDYKTGTPPKIKQIETAERPQLALGGLMLARGGFGAPIPADASVSALCYLGVGNKFSQTQTKDDQAPLPAHLIDAAADGMEQIISHLLNPASGFMATGNGTGMADHLARLEEWAVAGDGDEDAGTAEASA